MVQYVGMRGGINHERKAARSFEERRAGFFIFIFFHFLFMISFDLHFAC